MNVRKCKTAMLLLIIGSLFVCASRPSWAETKKSDHPESATTTKDHSSAERQSFLGVVISPLHPSLASHLPNMLIKGQGVMVSSVTPDSPAAKAGIKSHDILVKYGDQKLFSAEQLIKLVRAEKSGQDVAIELVRAGKSQTVHVSLSSRPADAAPTSNAHPWWSEFMSPWFGGNRAMHPRPKQHASATNGNKSAESKGSSTTKSDGTVDWTSFDSLTLHRLDDKHFKAEIKYLNDDQSLETKTFEGTQEEIETAVKNTKDLPDHERDHLLRAIENPEPVLSMPNFGIDQDFDFYWQPFQRDF